MFAFSHIHFGSGNIRMMNSHNCGIIFICRLILNSAEADAKALTFGALFYSHAVRSATLMPSVKKMLLLAANNCGLYCELFKFQRDLIVTIGVLARELSYEGRLIINAHSEIFCRRSKVAMRTVCPCSHNPLAQRCKVSFLSLHRF